MSANRPTNQPPPKALGPVRINSADSAMDSCEHYSTMGAVDRIGHLRQAFSIATGKLRAERLMPEKFVQAAQWGATLPGKTSSR